MISRLKSVRVLIFLVAFFIFNFTNVKADLVDDLKGKIDERNRTIADLEKEIVEYQSQIEKTSTKAKSLKNDIATLELTRKKLSTEISVLQNRIVATNLNITQLDGQINDTISTINRTTNGIATTLQKTNQEESTTLVETLLNYPRISTFLDKIESLGQLNLGLQEELKNLKNLKVDLQTKEAKAEGKRKELVSLAGGLSDKKKVAEYNKAQTAQILHATNSIQSNYQKILEQKIALRDAFEKEILDYESLLKIAIDSNTLPQTGSGVLSWPVDKVRVTQYFGNTDFAKANKQVYNGLGHSGIDLRASIGTPIRSALSGTVKGVGDTDLVCPGASYGRWVLVEHYNGLSTLYAHLSVIKVSLGQNLDTGNLVGYSGETGYATGPHLHFTVYATQGVKIMSRKSTICKGTYTMPFASLNAYLNPLLYL